MEAQGGEDVKILLIHDLGGQLHAPAALYPRGKDPPGTHCTGGWVGLRAGLDTEDRGKILSPLPVTEPRSPVARHCTD
jgi:hypothetical protein